MTTQAQRAMKADVKSRIIDGTGAVTIGAQNNIALLGITIIAAAAAVTATVAGFYKWDGTTLAAANIVFTGPDSDIAGEIDAYFDMGGGVNEAGALIVTASVDEKVVVHYREV